MAEYFNKAKYSLCSIEAYKRERAHHMEYWTTSVYLQYEFIDDERQTEVLEQSGHNALKQERI